MEEYVGLDVSKGETSFCVMDAHDAHLLAEIARTGFCRPVTALAFAATIDAAQRFAKSPATRRPASLWPASWR